MEETVLIFLACLLLLLNLGNVHAGLRCYGDKFFPANGTYGKNRNDLLSSLSSNVTAKGGFYNASVGSVFAVALCRRGYEREACISCVDKVSRNLINQCAERNNAYSWDGDDNVSCLVRYANHSTFGELVISPADAYPDPSNIITSNVTLFDQEWVAMVNRTLEAASTADNSSTLKYYAVTKAATAALSEFQNVFVFMQCTPDISPGDCYICLQQCLSDYRNTYLGRQGGEVGRPSCFFRWNLYPFYGAFDNLTTVPAPPRAIPQASQRDQPNNNRTKRGSRFSSGTIAIIVVPAIVNFFVFVALIYVLLRNRKSYVEMNKSADSDGPSTLRFDLDTIRTATDDFSSENKLGQGGFGSVYKGILPNGQEIAVKRLSIDSGQGDLEFKNEVLLLTRLQHRNLVKLLGFCLEGDEELLVYEFVPNSSLDHLIFDPEKRTLLTWDIRYRIIEGIIRGLLYLHEDSQLRIIHRDLKTSNILLDAEMNPKVSDFGMAKLFNMDETRGVTSRVVGTCGYMAPEYVRHGQFSVKSDIYSFGVMLLEIIGGKRNMEFEGEGLPSFAWKTWSEGRIRDIIDPVLSDSPINEIMKCIHIGLLCVQENLAKRPTMNSIILWLSSETTTMPIPAAAAFTVNSHAEADTSPSRLNGSSASNQSRSEGGTFSLNEVPITELSPR